MNAFTHASYMHTHEILSMVVFLVWSTNMGQRSELAYVGVHNLAIADSEGTITFSSQRDLYLDLSDHGSQWTLLPLKAKSKFSPKSTKPSVLEASWALKGHLHIAGNNESKEKGLTKADLPLRRKTAEHKTRTTVRWDFREHDEWLHSSVSKS